MDGLLRTHFSTGNFDGTVGDDLIHVHVGLRTASGLPDAQWELVIQLAGDDFVGGFDDELRNVGREFSQVLIHQRASLLSVPKARISSGGMVSRPILKCSSERSVCAPQ